MVIEARGDDEAKDRAARTLLERAGMVFYAKQATNHWCASNGVRFSGAARRLCWDLPILKSHGSKSINSTV